MSWQMSVVATYLRVAYKRGMSTAERAQKRIGEPKGDSAPPPDLYERFRVTEKTYAGFTSYLVAPRVTASPDAVANVPKPMTVVYVHGGAYISGVSPQHWSLVAQLVDGGCSVVLPDYGLAPQHTYREAHQLLVELYADLLGDSAPDDIAFVGDSAGGGLALAFVQSQIDVQPMPGKLVLISPWLDVTMATPAVAAVKDPWLTAVGLIEAGRSWAGGDDPTHPQVSPLFGPVAGLPSTDLYIGSRDVFHPDCLAWVERCTSEGVPCHLEDVAGAVHVYPFTPTPEGRAATRRIVGSLTQPTS